MKSSRFRTGLIDHWWSVWNIVMYHLPSQPDEGVRVPLRPRLFLRLWQMRDGPTERAAPKDGSPAERA